MLLGVENIDEVIIQITISITIIFQEILIRLIAITWWATISPNIKPDIKPTGMAIILVRPSVHTLTNYVACTSSFPIPQLFWTPKYLPHSAQFYKISKIYQKENLSFLISIGSIIVYNWQLSYSIEIFCHLNSCFANAIHNFKWLNITWIC